MPNAITVCANAIPKTPSFWWWFNSKWTLKLRTIKCNTRDYFRNLAKRLLVCVNFKKLSHYFKWMLLSSKCFSVHKLFENRLDFSIWNLFSAFWHYFSLTLAFDTFCFHYKMRWSRPKVISSEQLSRTSRLKDQIPQNFRSLPSVSISFQDFLCFLPPFFKFLNPIH